MVEAAPSSRFEARRVEPRSFDAIFSGLTQKQHEVLWLVAECRTSKEIAGALGVTESAINQRIEAVRNRAGFARRAELARAYRHYITASTTSDAMARLPHPLGAEVREHQESMGGVSPGGRSKMAGDGKRALIPILGSTAEGREIHLSLAVVIFLLAVGLLCVMMLGLGLV